MNLVGGRGPRACAEWTVALLLTALAVLPALAQARPPDQVWLSGIYDDDHDDVVARVMLASGLDTDAIQLAGPALGDHVCRARPRALSPAAFPRPSTRAPPAPSPALIGSLRIPR